MSGSIVDTTPDLFIVRPVKLLPPAQAHSETSRGAAKEIASETETLRAKVYALLLECQLNGCTDEEIQIELKMNPSTQRPRRIELVKAGLVVDSGETRETTSGRRATVWRCV